MSDGFAYLDIIFFAMVAAFITRMAVWSGMMGGGRGRDNGPPVFLIVLHQEQTSQALIHLRARAHVRVWVIPVRPRAISHFELVHVFATVTDG